MHQTASPDRGAVATGGVWTDQVAARSGSGLRRRGASSWPCGQHVMYSKSESKSNSNSQCYMMGVEWVGRGFKGGSS
jgi:hypothetical protein